MMDGIADCLRVVKNLVLVPWDKGKSLLSSMIPLTSPVYR